MVCDRSQKEKKQTVCGDTGNKVQVVQDLVPLCQAFFSNLCRKQLNKTIK